MPWPLLVIIPVGVGLVLAMLAGLISAAHHLTFMALVLLVIAAVVVFLYVPEHYWTDDFKLLFHRSSW